VGSLVSIVGTIVNPIRRTDKGLCRFSVENENGKFYIQSPKKQLLVDRNRTLRHLQLSFGQVQVYDLVPRSTQDAAAY
jgi:hypothetical protein